MKAPNICWRLNSWSDWCFDQRLPGGGRFWVHASIWLDKLALVIYRGAKR